MMLFSTSQDGAAGQPDTAQTRLKLSIYLSMDKFGTKKPMSPNMRGIHLKYTFPIPRSSFNAHDFPSSH